MSRILGVLIESIYKRLLCVCVHSLYRLETGWADLAVLNLFFLVSMVMTLISWPFYSSFDSHIWPCIDCAFAELHLTKYSDIQTIYLDTLLHLYISPMLDYHFHVHNSSKAQGI